MSQPVRIPKLSIGMQEAVLVQWLANDGEAIHKGTPIFVIESEKVETEIESFASGVLQIVEAAGSSYQVGTVIGYIG